VITSIVNFSQQADFGMPASGRVRMAALRPLQVTGVVSASGQKCALMDVVTPVAGYRHIVTDVVVKGAFPGTSAWSPPI